MLRSDFTFRRMDGVDYTLSDHNGYLVYKGEMTTPQLRVNEHKVDGRDGLLHSTSGDYDERAFTIPCVFKTYREAQSLINAFNGMQGELKMNYLDGWYKVSSVTGVYTRDAKGIPEIDVLVMLHPFAYLDNITKEITATGFKFENLGELIADCVISVVGSGNGTLEINGHPFKFTSLNQTPVVINTELGDITRGGINAGELLEGNIDNAKIKVGQNLVNFSGGIQKVTIDYRPKLFR